MDTVQIYTAVNKNIQRSGLPLVQVAHEAAKEAQETVTASLPQTSAQMLRQLESGIHAAPPPDEDTSPGQLVGAPSPNVPAIPLYETPEAWKKYGIKNRWIRIRLIKELEKGKNYTAAAGQLLELARAWRDDYLKKMTTRTNRIGEKIFAETEEGSLYLALISETYQKAAQYFVKDIFVKDLEGRESRKKKANTAYAADIYIELADFLYDTGGSEKKYMELGEKVIKKASALYHDIERAQLPGQIDRLEVADMLMKQALGLGRLARFKKTPEERQDLYERLAALYLGAGAYYDEVKSPKAFEAYRNAARNFAGIAGIISATLPGKTEAEAAHKFAAFRDFIERMHDSYATNLDRQIRLASGAKAVANLKHDYISEELGYLMSTSRGFIDKFSPEQQRWFDDMFFSLLTKLKDGKVSAEAAGWLNTVKKYEEAKRAYKMALDQGVTVLKEAEIYYALAILEMECLEAGAEDHDARLGLIEQYVNLFALSAVGSKQYTQNLIAGHYDEVAKGLEKKGEFRAASGMWQRAAELVDNPISPVHTRARYYSPNKGEYYTSAAVALARASAKEKTDNWSKVSSLMENALDGYKTFYKGSEKEQRDSLGRLAYAVGTAYMAAGNFGRALGLYKRSKEMGHKVDFELMVCEAEILARSEVNGSKRAAAAKFFEAANLVDDALTRWSDNDIIGLYEKSAQMDIEAGNYDGALETIAVGVRFADAASLFPKRFDFSRLLEQLGDAALAVGQSNTAVLAYENAANILGFFHQDEKAVRRMAEMFEKAARSATGKNSGRFFESAAEKIEGLKDAQLVDRARGLYLNAASHYEMPWQRAASTAKYIMTYAGDPTLSDKPRQVEVLQAFVKEVVNGYQLNGSEDKLKEFYIKISQSFGEGTVGLKLLLAATEVDENPLRLGWLFNECAKKTTSVAALILYRQAAKGYETGGDHLGALRAVIAERNEILRSMEESRQDAPRLTFELGRTWISIETRVEKAFKTMNSVAQIDEIEKVLNSGVNDLEQNFGTVKSIRYRLALMAAHRRGILYLKAGNYEAAADSFMRLTEQLLVPAEKRALYTATTKRIIYLMTQSAMMQRDPSVASQRFKILAQTCEKFLQIPEVDGGDKEVKQLKTYADLVAKFLGGGVKINEWTLTIIKNNLEGIDDFKYLSELERIDLVKSVAYRLFMGKAQGSLIEDDVVSMARQVKKENELFAQRFDESKVWLRDMKEMKVLAEDVFTEKVAR